MTASGSMPLGTLSRKSATDTFSNLHVLGKITAAMATNPMLSVVLIRKVEFVGAWLCPGR